MRSTVTFSVLFASILVFSAMNAEARPGRGHHMGPRGDGFAPELLLDLNLTADQNAKIKTLRNQMKVDMESLHAKLEPLRDRMHEQWTAASPNEAAIMSLIDQTSAIKVQMKKKQAELRLDIYSQLTPEQKAKVRVALEERRERDDEMRECRVDGWRKHGPATTKNMTASSPGVGR